MKKFIVIYHMPPSAMEWTESTPESKEEGMKQWFAWKDRMGDKLIDFGSPLGKGIKLNPDGTSGEGSSNVAGYSIIQAEDAEAAIEAMENHPHLGWNADCDIEIHEFAEM